ncbi:MAG: PorP/SprF family type IX secretion system membrane protein [Crocinitomicaceae bacterium]|nr:PorP/SprF family type IX secretion system membrane protein [Crocinitomicaceae bacterium]
MENIKKGFIGSICMLLVSFSHAQDVHFSQAIYSPLTLSPAMAGVNGPMTAIVNYRSQWKSVAPAYSSIAASFDMRLNENRRNRRGIFAFGINFLNDQSGDSKISTTNANLNLAYHLILNKRSKLGVGIYTGFGQRAIDAGAGRWGSQFDGMAYNSALGSNEAFSRDQFSFIDVGTGFAYTFKNSESYITSNDQREFTVGGGVFHLSRPNYSFFSTNDELLFMRFNVFAQAIVGFTNTNLSIMPAVYFQRQGPSQEILVGSYFRYMAQGYSKVTGFNKGTYISLGTFYRYRDAFVVKGMIEWADFALGLAYDVNVSPLANSTKTRGGFEVFLKYGLTQALAQRTRSRI